MRWPIVALLLVACGQTTEPIKSRFWFHDDPLFEVSSPGAQVGTVLVTDRQTTAGIDEVIMARFDPAGDHGMYSLVDEEGDCRLYTARGFCDPVCDSLESVCVDGECLPHSAFVAVGELTVDGLGDRRQLDEHLLWNGLYQPTTYVDEGDGVADGLLADGRQITVTAEGSDAMPGFTGTVAGVDPLDSDLWPGRVVRLSDLAPLALSWESPDDDTRVRLVIRTGEIGHGTPPVEKLVCDLPDRGSLEIPRALIAQLPEMTLPSHGGVVCVGGCSEMPSGLMRYRATRVDTEAGRIEVVAAAETLFWAVH